MIFLGGDVRVVVNNIMMTCGSTKASMSARLSEIRPAPGAEVSSPFTGSPWGHAVPSGVTQAGDFSKTQSFTLVLLE